MSKATILAVDGTALSTSTRRAGVEGEYVERLVRARDSHARGGQHVLRRELFERFESLIAACGPYEVAPAKTRVAFMARVRFAGVNAVSDRGMTIAFGLPRPRRRPRREVLAGHAD